MTQHISAVLGNLKDEAASTLKLCNALGFWEKMADERLYKHTRADKIRNQTLYVSTSSPAWAHELSFLKTEMVDKFNLLAGEKLIKDIKFRVQ